MCISECQPPRGSHSHARTIAGECASGFLADCKAVAGTVQSGSRDLFIHSLAVPAEVTTIEEFEFPMEAAEPITNTTSYDGGHLRLHS